MTQRLLLGTARTHALTSRTNTTGTIYLLRINGRVWTPVVLPGAGAAEAKDLGVRYAKGISMARVRKNPSVGQYTFCRGVYSLSPYDTESHLLCAMAGVLSSGIGRFLWAGFRFTTQRLESDKRLS